MCTEAQPRQGSALIDTMALEWYRGYLALVGPQVDDIARNEISNMKNSVHAQHIPHILDPSSSFHITVCTKEESRDNAVKGTLPPLDSIDTRHLHVLGVGGNSKLGVFFVVVIWAAGQTLRKRVGLQSKQFHITLSHQDDHSIDKGPDSLLHQGPSTDISLPRNNPDLLDHLAFTFHLAGKYGCARVTATDLCKVAPTLERGYLRLGDAALKEGQHKLAMLAYACAFKRCSDTKVSEYCLKKLEECSLYTEWGCAFTDPERGQLHEAPRELLEPWSATLREELSARELQAPPSLCRLAREPVYVPHPTSISEPFYRLPRWFRWLVPFQIALMSTPRDAADIAALASPHLGIRHVLTLTEETPLNAAWFGPKNIRNTFLPVPNYHPPTIEQMDLVFRLLEDERNTPMLIHCGGGKGRAGTVAACYLVAYGFAKPDSSRTEPAMSASQAIAALRAIRPGSIETEQQEAFVAKYCSAIWKRHAVLPDLVSEPPPCPVESEGALPKDADLFVLVGLPGSGKSTFSRALMARDPRGWTYISQDDTGSRSACERAISNVRGGRVLLDLCNVSRVGRKEWLALAGHWAKSPVCVWFDYDRALCVSRAQNRAGHPTLPPGNRVRNAMEQMHGAFVRPTLAEGFKAVFTIRSFAAAEELVARLSPPVGLFKFPRTAHLLDLGSATSDDIVSSVPDVGVGDAHVVVTEKVDGANMGFSLSADRTQILVQNRSHYVNPASHEQFRKLGLWVDRHVMHRLDLMHVLDRDPLFAQRYVLFGEWLVATHSIPYTRLPDWFMAFDLYDRSTDSWADRRTLEGLLGDSTEIRMVPVVHQGRMPKEEELREMVNRPSMFYEGRVEGVYVKVERKGRVVSRGKVVRADFIAGNEHWSKGPLHLNALEPPTEPT